MCTDIMEGYAGFIYMIDPEHGSRTFLPNIGKHLPGCMASHPERE
jgi:hypothetical protein